MSPVAATLAPWSPPDAAGDDGTIWLLAKPDVCRRRAGAARLGGAVPFTGRCSSARGRSRCGLSSACRLRRGAVARSETHGDSWFRYEGASTALVRSLQTQPRGDAMNLLESLCVVSLALGTLAPSGFVQTQDALVGSWVLDPAKNQGLPGMAPTAGTVDGHGCRRRQVHVRQRGHRRRRHRTQRDHVFGRRQGLRRHDDAGAARCAAITQSMRARQRHRLTSRTSSSTDS